MAISLMRSPLSGGSDRQPFGRLTMKLPSVDVIVPALELAVTDVVVARSLDVVVVV